MVANIQAIRGMNDILPEQATYWRYLEDCLIDLALSYGYQELRSPIVEQTALFKRSIGEATDIVEKEMYTFADRNGESLSLRPENTAGCVRAGIEHGLLYNQVQRFWYLGPMFRHERPQKGRYRQFYQFGIEAFGMAGPDIDAEVILFGARLWKKLGLSQHIRLELNSLGTSEARAQYRSALVEYFTAHYEQLDEDSKRRLTVNPLRILDSKNPALQTLIAQAPMLPDCLDAASAEHFQQLCQQLEQAGVAYTINPRLVRGLDYYGATVFEWVTDLLGSQSAVCSGGRYDSLVELLGGKSTPAVGFALGLERLVLLLEMFQTRQEKMDIYCVVLGELAQNKAMLWVERWRDELPHARIILNCGGGNLKSQLKKADKSGARFAFILGEDEVRNNAVTIKFLREESPQITVALANINDFFAEQLNSTQGTCHEHLCQ